MKKLFTSAICLLSLFPLASKAQLGIIRTIAGIGLASYSGDHGPATGAALNGPNAVFIDDTGNILLCDASNERVRKVNMSGIISTIAGTGVAGYSGDGGSAATAEFNDPTWVITDHAGNIYISDYYNNRVRKISATGIVTTVAGDGISGYGGDGGPATAAEVQTPYGLALDSHGDLYIASELGHRIRMVDPSGVISTIAGNGTGGLSGDDGPATASVIRDPTGMCIDGHDNLYFCDNGNHCIRKISTSGMINTVAGNGTGGYTGDGMSATASELYYPSGIGTDPAGNIYIADGGNNRVRMVNPSGIISTLAGNGIPGYSGDGGPSTAATCEVNGPIALAVDAMGDVVFADYFNNVIRRIGTVDNSPVFTAGTSQSLAICSGESPTPINTQLTITDPDVGQPETWRTGSAPSHGILVASYTTTSTGTSITPTGLSYQPTSGYVGTDVFVVEISDGILTTNTTVNVTVAAAPDAGVISGPDSVCPGHTVTLTETASHGIWSTSSYSLSDISSAGVVTGLLPGSDTIIYTVINSCGIASAIFPFTISDCGEGVATVNGANHGLLLFPDPAEEQINIVSPEPIKQICIINVSGQIVLNRANSASTARQTMLDVSKLPSGIYVVKVNTTGILKFEKM